MVLASDAAFEAKPVARILVVGTTGKGRLGFSVVFLDLSIRFPFFDIVTSLSFRAECYSLAMLCPFIQPSEEPGSDQAQSSSLGIHPGIPALAQTTTTLEYRLAINNEAALQRLQSGRVGTVYSE
jgi:hypothetical protein